MTRRSFVAPRAAPGCARRSFGPRRLVAALVLVTLGAVALAAPARAGTFRVSQCNASAGGLVSPRAFQGELWSARRATIEEQCGAGFGMVRLRTPNFRLAENGSASAFMTLPSRMPGSALRTAWLDWHFNPQAPSTNPADFEVWAHGALVLLAQPGEGSQPGYPTPRELPTGTRQLEAKVWCSPLNGVGWCNWHGPLLDLRGVTFEVEEHGEPGGAASGPLMAAGDHAGVEPLELAASDGDSGVRAVAVTLAGTPVGTLRPAGGCRDDRLPPCPQSLRGTIDVDTRAVADGSRRLRLVVTDAAGNTRTVDAGIVDVRNQGEAGTPPGPPDGGAPSPAPGEGGAPVSTPPGGGRGPLFPGNPLAGRGHVANGRRADERARVAAWLEPLGDGHRRRTATIPPGVRVRIRGRLTNRRGRPIGRATLAAIRREDGGPWKPVTGVRTRPNGRFTAFTRIGPSQRIRFVYYAFGDSRSGRRSPTLHVRVRRE